MTSTAILHIFFHGLIALVNNRPDPGKVSAYALTSSEHETFIAFKLQGNSKCPKEESGSPNADCKKMAKFGYDLCICHIEDKPVTMEFNPLSQSPSKARFPGRPFVARPLDIDSTSNPSWLVRMADVDGDEGRAQALKDVSDKVRVDMSFEWTKVKTCHLDQVTDESECAEKIDCEYRIYPNRFVTTASSSSGYVQALAESVTFTVPFPSKYVELELKNRGGVSGWVKLVLDCSSGKCPDLLFVNDIYEFGHEKSGALEDIGTHFLEYYQVAAGNPKKRFPVRLREESVSLPVGDEQWLSCTNDLLVFFSHAPIQEPAPSRTGVLDADQLFDLLQYVVGRGFQTRVICPMAVFEN